MSDVWFLGSGGNSADRDSSGGVGVVRIFSFLIYYIPSLEQHMTSYGRYRLIWSLGKFFFSC